MKFNHFRCLFVCAFCSLLFIADFAEAQCGGRGGRRGGIFGGRLFNRGGAFNSGANGCAGGQQYAPQGQFQYFQQPYQYQQFGGCSNGQCSVVLQNPRLTYLARINATPAPVERPYFASR